MSEPSYRLPALDYAAPPRFTSVVARRRVWPNVLLFLLTIVTTLAVGAQLDHNYARGRAAFDLDSSLNPFAAVMANPALLWNGVPFSLTLLGILLAHEMGHYLACRYYGIAASLPYFIPAPTLIGTMGAFIRIRAPIVTRRALFDVGIAGPIAGFLVAVPVLAYGVWSSRVVPVMHNAGAVVFGDPLLVRLLEDIFHPGVPSWNVYLHPVARAAWVGLFATALNLIPIGQLDGGHILYAIVGEKHKLLSRVFLVLLLPLGYFYWYGWFFWAVLLFFLGMRHPVIFDPMPLDGRRRWLAAGALAMFVLCFMPSPFTTP